MNKLVIAVAAVSSAFIPVAQAADYTYQSGDPKEASSWKDATGETPETAPGETDGVVFGAAGTADTFPVKSDLTYSKFTAKNADGDTTIDLTSDSAAVTNSLDITDELSIGANTLAMKGGKVAVTNDLTIAEGGKFVLEEGAAFTCYANLSSKGGLHIKSGASYVVRTIGGDRSYSFKELIVEGEGSKFGNVDYLTSLNLSGAKITIRDSGAVTHGHWIRLKDGTELNIVDNGKFANAANNRLSAAGESVIYVSNTVFKLPNIDMDSGARLLVCNDTTLNRSDYGHKLKNNAAYVVDGESASLGLMDSELSGKNALFEVKNGAKLSTRKITFSGDNSGMRVSNGSTYAMDGNKNFGLLVFSVSNAWIEVDDSTFTMPQTFEQSCGRFSVAGKNAKVTFKSDYILNNETAANKDYYSKLTFTLPEAAEDVWTTAPVQVGTTATIGANAKLVVEVPKTLIKKMSVPLLTAKTSLTVENLDALKSDATIPEGATLAVGDWDAAKGKWVAAENGKTLFINLPSRQGFMIILK